MIDSQLFKKAAKSAIPVYFGYLPTGFVFGLLMTAAGYHWILATAMSVFIYAGAGQYLAVGLIVGGAGLAEIAVLTFLINSKHLFYGLSMLDSYKNAGWRRLYLIFSLTDEAYALLTAPGAKELAKQSRYCLYVSASIHTVWILGTLLGGLFGSVVTFNAKGMDFALTALFTVILIEQLKSYNTKLPFFMGGVSAALALPLVGRSNMLLAGCLMAGTALIIFRKGIVNRDVR